MTIFGVVIIGLILRSFYNVCIFRYISRESVVFPPSHCPHCLHQLAWYELLPWSAISACGDAAHTAASGSAFSPPDRAALRSPCLALRPRPCPRRPSCRCRRFARGLRHRCPHEYPAGSTHCHSRRRSCSRTWVAGHPRCLLGGGSFWLLSVLYRRFRGRDGLGWETPNLCVCSARWLAPWPSPQLSSWAPCPLLLSAL